MYRKQVLLVIILVPLSWGISALVDRDSEDSEPVNVIRDDGKEVASPEQPKEPYVPEPDKGSRNDKPDKGAKRGGKEDENSAKDDVQTMFTNEKDCSLADLQTTAASNQPNYGDEQPTLTITVHSPTGDECHTNLGEQQLRFEVYDLTTYEHVWSDADCSDSEGRGGLISVPSEGINYIAT